MHLFTAHRVLISSGIAAAVAFAGAGALHVDEATRGAATGFVVAGSAAALGLGAYLRWFRRKTARLR